MTTQRYVSNELSHFIGRAKQNDDDRYGLLLKILKDGCLSPPPHDLNANGVLTVDGRRKFSTNEMYSPQMVCFCDIPVVDMGLHASKYSPFGLSFLKDFVAGQGGMPVFYVPEKARGSAAFWPSSSKGRAGASGRNRGEALNDEVAAFKEFMSTVSKRARAAPADTALLWQCSRVARFLDLEVFSYVKVFDHTLADNDPLNYYMEREWRIVGKLNFSLANIERVFLPQRYAAGFRAAVPGYHRQLTFID